MSRDEALTVQAVQRWLASWLKPNKVPEGIDFTLGVPCFLLLDYADGRNLDSGRVYKTSEGELVFCLDRGGWCTSQVKAWKPKHENVALVADAE